MPSSRKGSSRSHTNGKATRASSASGQHNTNRMHHSRNLTITIVSFPAQIILRKRPEKSSCFGASRDALPSEELDVNVGAQSDVISQIPAVMVRVIVDHDVVAIPEPVIGVVVIGGRNAEVEPAKPEAIPAAALDAELVTPADAARKAAMLPRMIEMKAGIITARFVPDPLIVRVNVGSVRMPRFVIECAIWLRGMPLAPNGRRAMRRNVAAALTPAAAVSTTALHHRAAPCLAPEQEQQRSTIPQVR